MSAATDGANRHGHLWGQAAGQAVSDRPGREAEPFRGLTDGHRFAVHGEHPVRSEVALLCSRRSPATVARFVRALIVDAVQRMSLRTPTHVSKKRREVISPSITHRNSATAISLVIRGSRVVAPSLHCSPSRVLARASTWTIHAGLAVRTTTTPADVALQAAAAARPSGDKVLGQDSSGGTAIAATDPCRRATYLPSHSKNSETAESMTGQFNFWRHCAAHYNPMCHVWADGIHVGDRLRELGHAK